MPRAAAEDRRVQDHGVSMPGSVTSMAKMPCRDLVGVSRRGTGLPIRRNCSGP
jgi:hypothetical protein